MLKWLQWSTIDLEKGQGGVEAHARCLARELKALHGVNTTFSRNPVDLLSSQYDVIQTHGSSIPAMLEFNARIKNRRPLWVQTLHGLSFERMWACGEWSWLGGYGASAREIASVLQSDVVLSVHDQLSIYPLVKRTKKYVEVCSNGWDSFQSTGESGAGDDLDLSLAEDIKYKLEGADPFWVFIGRGDDPVKNVGLVKTAWSGLSDLNLVCVPGSGFENVNWALRLGPLPPAQIRAVLLRARGLVITSHYEGLPLVVLEALALGTPVVATRVGGLKTLSPRLEGLKFVSEMTGESVRNGVEYLKTLGCDGVSKERRAEMNRRYLSTWQQVATRVYDVVSRARGGES